MKVWIILVLSFGAATCHANWPTFLGVSSAIDSDPPLKWSPTTGVSWKRDLPGHGQSSPIFVGDRVYVTAIEGPMKERNLVCCYSIETGELNWQHESASSLTVKNDVYTSRAAPTPVADENGVYAFFESGNLMAFNADGEVQWERDFVKDYGQYQGRFGLGSSLAQTDDLIFVLADNEGPAYIAALDKLSGETVWKTDRTPRTAWSSPIVIPVGGEPHIVVSAAGSIDGYSPKTGELLWTYDDVGGNTVASPTMVADATFLVGASPGRNGESSEGARKSNLLMRIEREGGSFKPSVLWKNEQATSSFGSPIAYREHAYFTNRAGVVYCIDLASGDIRYTARMAESNWATPVGIGDHVFFFGKGGVTTVMRTGPKQEIVAKNRLWESGGGGGPGGFGGEIQYGVAVLPDGFLVRTGTRLFRLSK